MSLGHRKGLAVLFMTEMWERYSFYALRALLVLYLTARASDGGLGWDRADALRLIGIYLGAAYITPIIGGYCSDHYLGQRRSAMIGAVMMALGAAMPHELPDPIVFRADHPFAFAIADRDSGALLFLGRLAEPRA